MGYACNVNPISRITRTLHDNRKYDNIRAAILKAVKKRSLTIFGYGQ